MVKVEYHGDYPDDLKKILFEYPDLRLEINRRIKLFKNNPNDSRLENHLLTKRMSGKFAFSITDNIRIVYEWVGKSTVRFLAIGKHTKAYSQKYN